MPRPNWAEGSEMPMSATPGVGAVALVAVSLMRNRPPLPTAPPAGREAKCGSSLVPAPVMPLTAPWATVAVPSSVRRA